MGMQQMLIGMGGGFAGTPSGITATGGTMYTGQKNDDGTPYTWHVFPGGPRGPETNLTYDFDVTAVNGPGDFEYIMFGGGGMGGISPNPDPGANPYGGAGGGGAGGLICNFHSPPIAPSPESHIFAPYSPGPQTASVQAYPISVGRAAAGNPAPERNGKNTEFLGQTAYGGGMGGHANGPSSNTDARPGGCGGGSGQSPGYYEKGFGSRQGGTPGSTTPTPISPQGKDGGERASGSTNFAGGGGGAFGAGQPGSNGSIRGMGGSGAQFNESGYYKIVPGFGDPVGAARYFCGGGGGGSIDGSPEWDPYGNTGKGGSGGGGDSGTPDGNGGNADNWTGGGGGGAGGGPQTRFGGQGGQGMVFIRYVD
jgi:hypothetical protein